MPVSRIIGGHVISEAEYNFREGEIEEFKARRARGRGEGSPLTVSRGREVTELDTTRSIAIGNLTLIGPGLPLTINIEHLYTGQYPERGAFGHRGDIAVFSGVKNFSATNATARAVNYLEPGVMPHTHFDAPTVFNQGTTVVLYSPAITESQLTFSLEIASANNFARELLDQLSSAFKSLAGIPVLLPYAGYLLGAGTLMKLAGGIADVLYQNQASFLRTEVIRLSGPGTPDVAGLRVVHNSALDASNFSYKERVGLIDSTGQRYDGDEPYVVISLDGARNDALKGFTSAVATAAQLQNFLGTKDGAAVAIDTLVGAIGLYSDMRYRLQADKLSQEIEVATADEKAVLQKQRDAMIKNIIETSLKPK